MRDTRDNLCARTAVFTRRFHRHAFLPHGEVHGPGEQHLVPAIKEIQALYPGSVGDPFTTAGRSSKMSIDPVTCDDASAQSGMFFLTWSSSSSIAWSCPGPWPFPQFEASALPA